MSLALGAALGVAGSASAEPLDRLLVDLLDGHERIRAARADLEGARQSARRAFGEYLPTVDLTLGAGQETTIRPGQDPTRFDIHDHTLKVKQLIWDFGKTSADVAVADIGVQRSELALRNAQQSLTLDAVTAYLNLVRAVQSLQYARQSEANIRRQTGLEEFRVERGAGVAADVLQVKGQLAGAVSTRVRAEGALQNSANRFRAVFRREPGNLAGFVPPVLPLAKLPRTLDDAVAQARQANIDLLSARAGLDVAKQSLRSENAKLWGPRIEFIGELHDKKDTAATAGDRHERLAKVELTFPLFAGGKQQASVRSSEQALFAATDRLVDLERTIEASTRDAWQNVRTQGDSAGFLRNQANITGEFLDLARKERQLGRRSLIDLLSGETNFISAVSAAVSAETDYAIAVYQLFAATGKLDLATVIGESKLAPKPAAAAKPAASAPDAGSSALRDGSGQPVTSSSGPVQTGSPVTAPAPQPVPAPRAKPVSRAPAAPAPSAPTAGATVLRDGSGQPVSSSGGPVRAGN